MSRAKKIHDTACGRIVAYGMIRRADSVDAPMTAAVRSPSLWSAKTRIATVIGGISP